MLRYCVLVGDFKVVIIFMLLCSSTLFIILAMIFFLGDLFDIHRFNSLS